MVQTPRQPLRVLLVEDEIRDAELVIHHLEQSGYDVQWQRVDDEPTFLAGLQTRPDVVLADFHLPSFGAPRALTLLKDAQSPVPMIVVSGSVGEEAAVSLLRNGAADYLLKDRLARLGPAIHRALTECRQAADRRDIDARTKFAMDAARVGVWESDLQTGVVRWSETLEALHGLAVGTFGGTLPAFLERIHPQDRAAVQERIEESSRLKTDAELLYRTVWPDGSLHWITGTGRTFYDAAGTPVRAAGVSLDVTERHQIEEQYRQSQKVEAIGQLAGGIAHDFNNLLTAIQGYCELLQSAVGDESVYQADLGEIHRASQRATNLTRQLLAFSRRQILEPRVVDLRESLRGMSSMLRRLIGEDLEIVVRTADVPARVLVDPGQVEQIILNLALNARDAMPSGGSLLLEVTSAELDDAYARRHIAVKPGRYIMLSVSDTGVGMDEATQARIFEPFYTTKPRGSGTGLGLSTVYGIVKQSGGNIWVYSELGRGSTFKVYLPAVEMAVAEAPQAPAEQAVLTGSETILVVEDEPGVRHLVRRILSGLGYHVIVTASPKEALNFVLRNPEHIHLLLSDVVLPEMSGREMADALLHMRQSVRVLFMSGYTDEAIVHRGILDAGTTYVQKPFTPAGLARKVREVLDAS